MAFLRSIFGRDKDQTTANSSPSQQQIARPDTRAMVFVGGQDHKLRALDAHTGKQKWEFDAGGWVETIPATWQGVLIGTSWNLQTDEARVFALDILTGSTVWELRPGWGETCSPAVLDGMAFIGASNNNLYALDLRTGRIVWEFETQGRISGSPTVSDGLVFVGSDDGNLYAVSPSSGLMEWQAPTDGRVWGSPAVADGRVYFGSDDWKLHVVETATSVKVWEFQTGEDAPQATNRDIGMSYPVVGDGLVFVGSMDTHVYALEPETGRIVWRFDAEDIVSPPAVWEDLVIVGSHGFQALDAKTGRPVWKSEADMLTVGAPTIWRDQVFVVGSGPPIPKPADMDVPDEAWRSLGLVSCRLYALDARTGNQIWGSPHTTDGDMSSASVWEEGKSDWPMFRGNPQHTGIGVPVTGRGN